MFLNVYKVDSLNNKQIIHQIKCKDSTRFIVPINITTIGDKYLCEFGEGAYYYSSPTILREDINASARSVMLVDPSQFGLISSTTNQDEIVKRCKLYPNPANELISIEFEQEITGKVHIYDIHGKIIKETSVKQTNTHTLSIIDFSVGMYTLSASTYDGSNLYIGRFVKM
jgi:hypothetical protein